MFSNNSLESVEQLYFRVGFAYCFAWFGSKSIPIVKLTPNPEGEASPPYGAGFTQNHAKLFNGLNNLTIEQFNNLAI